MITLGTSNTIQGVAATQSSVVYTIAGMEVSGGTETYKILANGDLPTAAAILYTPPCQSLVKTIMLANTTAGALGGVELYVGSSGSTIGADDHQISPGMTIPAGGAVVFNQLGWNTYNAVGQVQAAISVSGADWAKAAGSSDYAKACTSADYAKTCTSAVTVSGITGYGIMSQHTSSVMLEYNFRAATTISNSLATSVPVTFGFPVTTSQAYLVYGELTTRGMSGGVNIIVTGPAAATVEGELDYFTSATTYLGLAYGHISALLIRSNLTPIGGGTSGVIYTNLITYGIATAGTAGSSCIICQPQLSGQRAELLIGSYIHVEPAISV